MNIVCLSSVEDPDFIEAGRLKEKLSTADSNYNYRIITGLDKNNDRDCVLLNYVPVGSYPDYKKIILRTKYWKKDERKKSYNIGFINITGLKYVSLTINYILKLNTVLRHTQEKVYVVCYDLYLPFLLAVNYLKKRNHNLISCLIVPAFPEHVMRNSLKERIKGKLSKMIMKEAEKYECFVFLTKQMKEKIRTENYTVVEGIIPDEYKHLPIIKKAKDENSKFSIVYTGRLDRIFHIDLLIDAVKKIEKYKVELILCGHGDLVEEIKGICSLDARIRYRGFLNAAELSELQRNADILINTRFPEGEYTKYSFPSKTMEYLASGTPVLMYELPGIPEEYAPYLNYLKGKTAEAIQFEIERMINGCISGNAIIKAQNAKRYVAQHKDSAAQGKKVLDLLKKQ